MALVTERHGERGKEKEEYTKPIDMMFRVLVAAVPDRSLRKCTWKGGQGLLPGLRLIQASI